MSQPRRRAASHHLVEREARAFAAIVEELGDPEWRSLRWTLIAVGAAVLVAAAAVVRFVLAWPAAAAGTFLACSVIGALTGVLVTGRCSSRGPL